MAERRLREERLFYTQMSPAAEATGVVGSSCYIAPRWLAAIRQVSLCIDQVMPLLFAPPRLSAIVSPSDS